MKDKTQNFAMLVSGCGHLDGAEVSETVFAMLAMDRHNITFEAFAINANQSEVYNHSSNTKSETENRNMLVEAARITRKINDIKTLQVDKYDALVMPGGLGVAKNFSNLGFVGENFDVIPEIREVIFAFAKARKPIGAICIAPAIVARVINNSKVTLGEHNPLLANIGASEIICDASDIAVDTENMIVSTPAFMLCGKAKLHEIADGVEKLIRCIQEMCVIST